MKSIDKENLEQILILLEHQLKEYSSKPIELVICGGTALIATSLVERITKDVDILAVKDLTQGLIDPEPLSAELSKAALAVAKALNLPLDWLNTGPADLFRMGLPAGFEKRLIVKRIGPLLAVHFISRLDQVYFKLYASVDRGGYHIQDLLALRPTENELFEAAKWSQTQDVSDGYKALLKEFLNQIEFPNAAQRI